MHHCLTCTGAGSLASSAGSLPGGTSGPADQLACGTGSLPGSAAGQAGQAAGPTSGLLQGLGAGHLGGGALRNARHTLACRIITGGGQGSTECQNSI